MAVLGRHGNSTFAEKLGSLDLARAASLALDTMSV